MTKTFEQSQNEIARLVDAFHTNRPFYFAPEYKEASARQDLIDPLFIALGWDVRNDQRVAPQQREVLPEYALVIERHKKSADYLFRSGHDKNLFFVEAKKPGVPLKTDPASCYQVRRYGWTKKLPLSILTDFEEFAVYDCNARPYEKDAASVARLEYYTYPEYPDKWRKIWDLFSKDAVLQGALDQFIGSAKTKRGTQPVDAEFLKEIEGWRAALAKNIALLNPRLSLDDLNDAVQRTIDRIIFLRMAEDRGTEEYGRMQTLAARANIYAELLDFYFQADTKYNSGLFDFKTEPLALSLKIDDDKLRAILRDLYYPKSPYVFSALAADTLGNVYEQFLGKVIRLTPAHQAKIEEKPEVKKAGGVYYTPKYIVDYIVKQTVEKLIENKSPKEIEKVRVLDPACGSGSFLLGAYQVLLDHHLNWYIANRNASSASQSPIYQSAEGWRLTTAEKKRILLNNIFGVDIDRQAVEVTKLSLLLKVLEGESEETLNTQLVLFKERALPNLDQNIKCGNSLIGPDYFSGQMFTDAEELKRVNPFDWAREFPEVMKAGGFDCVIGNPPYVSVELTIKDVTEFYLKTYESAVGRANSFSLFIERDLDLLKENGSSGLIISNRLLTNAQLMPLRKLILEKSRIENILTFKRAVFKAAVDTVVLIFRKAPPSDKGKIEIWYDITDLEKEDFQVNQLPQSTFWGNPSYIFNVRQKEDLGVIKRMQEKSVQLDRICDVKDGIILGAIKDLFLSDVRLDKRYEKWLEGNEVSRYHIQWTERYICYDPSLIEEELERKHKKAKQQAKTSSDFKKLSRSGIWLRKPEIFRQQKILTRQNAKRLIGVLDEENYFTKNSLHCILLKDKSYNLKYVLGLINSSLMNYYFQNQIGSTGEIFSQMKIEYSKKLPIRAINFSDPADKARHDHIVALVAQMLELHKRLHAANSQAERELYQRQIDATDKQIDARVYDLYALTEKEIAIVEERAA